MKNNLISVVVIGAIVAGVAFYGGMQYGKGKSVNTAQSRFLGMNGGGGGQFGQGGAGVRGTRMGGASGGIVAGSILSKDNDSLTIKLRDGGSKIVFFSTSTEVQKSTSGSTSDLGVGADVVVIGGSNSDGSVTAQSIQIRPLLPFAR